MRVTFTYDMILCTIEKSELPDDFVDFDFCEASIVLDMFIYSTQGLICLYQFGIREHYWGWLSVYNIDTW